MDEYLIYETKNKLLMFEAQLDLITKMCMELKASIYCFRNSWIEKEINEFEEEKSMEDKK